MDELVDYKQILQEIKIQVQTSQHKAIFAVNKELILLYWNIGQTIISCQSVKGWGSKIVEKLSGDLKIEFPNIKGFSLRNLKYMRKFASEFPDIEFVQTLSAQISWSHNILIVEKLKDFEQRKWYIEQVIENGWSLSVLEIQISTDLYSRQVLAKKVSNFKSRLPLLQSEIALELLKDPYVFDLISFRKDIVEREIEKELVRHITKVLLELGSGFAFIGNQYHIELSGKDYYIDLLFYNLKLRCYFVIELKTREFIPEYAGKLNFYLSMVDDTLKTVEDNPSIGILLCRKKDKVTAEYALKDMTKPMGVSEYKFLNELPTELQDKLPNIDELKKSIMDIDCIEPQNCEID